jgi:hypothetical protein
MGWWGTTHSDRESFTVDADRERAELWRVAAAERCMSVPSWLADTADAHLRELARTGRAVPLSWHPGRFLVRLTDTTRSPWVGVDVEVPGLVSRPFGIYRGTSRGVGAPGSGSHTLTHIPTGRTGKRPADLGGDPVPSLGDRSRGGTWERAGGRKLGREVVESAPRSARPRMTKLHR